MVNLVDYMTYLLLVPMKNKASFLLFKANEIKNSIGEFNINPY